MGDFLTGNFTDATLLCIIGGLAPATVGLMLARGRADAVRA